MRNQTLRDLVLTAYGVRENELIGGADWTASTGFDLDARGAPDINAETARAVLRTLLTQRFSLEVHREQRDRPIYALMISARNGRPGDLLRPAAAECAAPTPPKGMSAGPPPSTVAMPVPLGVTGKPPRCPSIFLAGHFSGRAVPMDVLADELAEVARRPVVNRTGLEGEFDLDLRYTAELVAQPSSDAASAAPGLTTALQDQLGLKLEAGRGPVEVLVIDRALRPTEN